MRKALFFSIIVAISCGSVLGAVKDPRLSQKVTYRVKLRPIADLTSDLSKMTGVSFIAGKSNSDWRVREDCATVMAKDIPLATLMDSIAHALKFRWVRSGSAANWSYRLVEDPDAIVAVKRKEDAEKKRREERCRRRWDICIAALRMSETELANLGKTDPYGCLAVKSGVMKPMMEFLQQLPEAREAFVSGGEYQAAACWMPAGAKQALVRMAQASRRLDMQLYGQDLSQLHMAEGEAVLKDLESKADRLVVDINGTTMQVQLGNFSTGTYAPQLESELSRVFGEISLRAYEGKRPVQEVLNEIRPQVKEASKKDRERRAAERPPLGCDPGTTHAADLMKKDLLKDKVESKVITGFVESLAQNSGFAVVTADVRGRTTLTVPKGASVREALDKTAEHWYCNWSANGRVIEMWRADWYGRREQRVSKGWLEAMKAKLKKNGTFDIDDLAQFASLTDHQFSYAMQDETLSRLSLRSDVFRNYDFLKLYASLDWEQRSALFSSSGLYFAELDADQQKPILKQLRCSYVPMLASVDLSRLGLRLMATRESLGKGWLYTFTASTNLAPIPGRRYFRTPVYVPPKPKSAGKPALSPPPVVHDAAQSVPAAPAP